MFGVIAEERQVLFRSYLLLYGDHRFEIENAHPATFPEIHFVRMRQQVLKAAFLTNRAGRIEWTVLRQQIEMAAAGQVAHSRSVSPIAAGFERSRPVTAILQKAVEICRFAGIYCVHAVCLDGALFSAAAKPPTTIN
jgi:hypothetical protein